MARRSSPGWGRKQAMVRPEGQVRQSQVVTTFGPGAMMDLIDHAVLVGGLDFWAYDSRKTMGGAVAIQDSRLREAILKRSRSKGLELDPDRYFLEPPIGDDSQPSRASGVQVREFPSWFVCQGCRALIRANTLELKGGRYRHQCDNRKGSECVPVRFVQACKRGHIEDVRWIDFAHGYGQRCGSPSLRLLEGETGDFSQIVVRCACGKSQTLASAMVKELSPPCAGKRPWLGPEGKEECDEKLRLLVRTGVMQTRW